MHPSAHSFGLPGQSQPEVIRELWTFRLAVTFLAVSLVLGGAGLAYPMIEAVIEIAAIGLMLWLVARPLGRAAPPAKPLVAFGLAALALTLAQLVPLPPAIWRALPGHVLAVQGSDAAGLGEIWRPFSLTPDATRQDALNLLPPIAMLLATVRLGSGRRLGLLRIVLAVGLVSAALGALQFASGGSFSHPIRLRIAATRSACSPTATIRPRCCSAASV